MPVNLSNSNVATRENRIGSITGYVGTLKDLATQSECGTLKGCHSPSGGVKGRVNKRLLFSS